MGVERAIRRIGDDDGSSASSCCLAACHAFEIAANANAIYRHNFSNDRAPNFTLTEQQIERLTGLPEGVVVDNPSSSVDTLWTLSPPCQPFTRKPGANHLDIHDTRCRGLQDGVMRLLQETTLNKPRWILLENVKGFAGSTMCLLWQETLTACEYTWKEYLVSPTQLGIPNHRMRYYMVAEHSQRFAADRGTIYKTLPILGTDASPVRVQPLSEYIDNGADKDRHLRVPSIVWEKPWSHELDIVSDTTDETHCFTASYGRLFHPASGSLLRRKNDDDDSSFVRRFSPIEVARLLHFDASFALPDELKLERQYKHVANAVNVAVVACLVEELIKIS